MSNTFEERKNESVYLLAKASLPENEIDFGQAHGLAYLLSIIRAEMYDSGERITLDPVHVESFDAAIKRLFE